VTVCSPSQLFETSTNRREKGDLNKPSATHRLVPPTGLSHIRDLVPLLRKLRLERLPSEPCDRLFRTVRMVRGEAVHKHPPSTVSPGLIHNQCAIGLTYVYPNRTYLRRGAVILEGQAA
jgi:hypothetical protein